MRESDFPGDPSFAQDIDLFCASCKVAREMGFPTPANQFQINNLRGRRDISGYPHEIEALKRLLQQCQNCHEGERGTPISLQYSCLWRK